MPSALLRPCPEPGCPALTTGGPCSAHARQRERRRGSAASRGYGSSWARFRERFIARLIAFGIAPVCGAKLPWVQVTADSQCQAQHRLNGEKLHLDHITPLREEERSDRRAVENMDRIQLLCAACHSAKTLEERGRGARQ